MSRARLCAMAFFLALTSSGRADISPPPYVLHEVHAVDRPWDRGQAIVVSWLGDIPFGWVLEISRFSSQDSIKLWRVNTAAHEWVDTSVSPNGSYTYELAVYDPGGNRLSSQRTDQPASPRANVFDASRLAEAILIAFLFGIFLLGTYRKKIPNVRPIGGVAAMEEALGRAVEMGRPVLFSAGWGAQLDKPATMAAMNLFGYLARRAASYGAQLIFPAHDAVIMAAAQEAAREGARLEGRAEAYQEENIYYVTGSQFGYAAAIDGVLMRSKPAANFWLGTFAAESLIMAETGNQVGAVQIAGTDSTIQLAFFLVTCDYTLIGEEMFAASAYLSDDPKAKGALWAQDGLKVAVALTIVAGLVGALAGWNAIGDFLRSF